MTPDPGLGNERFMAGKPRTESTNVKIQDLTPTAQT